MLRFVSLARRSLPLVRVLQYAAELILIIVMSLYATSQYQNFDPGYHIGGLEVENVTSSAHFLSSALQRWGYVPYWQPYSNKGQPFMDEAYNFVLNPFNFIPVALLGDNNGIKAIIILHYVIAGIGGWALAKSLGMGMVGRVVLGGLLVIKGNMAGAFGAGFLQLGLAQAYFPWVLAGALAIPHYPHKRWPVVLLALALALLFFCGTIYYMLPAVLLAVFTFVFYGLSLSRKPLRVHIDRALLRRFLLAALLMVGLIAVTALTIGLNFGLIGNHPDQTKLTTLDIGKLFYQVVTPEVQFYGLFAEFIYSYVAPLWFLVLLFVLLPPLPSLNRPASFVQGRHTWRLGVFGLLLFFVWGVALPPVPWIYANIPGISQWRFPERMLAVATFLLVFLIGYRIDGLYRALRENVQYAGRRTGSIARFVTSVCIIVAAAFALAEAYQNLYLWGYTYQEDRFAVACLRWIREHYSDDFMSVQKSDFFSMAENVRTGVRMASIGAAYYVTGRPSELYPPDLTRLHPPLHMPTWYETPEMLRGWGYVPLEGSPPFSDEFADNNCVWYVPDAPDYAFAISMTRLRFHPEPLTRSITRPVTYLARMPEHIWLRARPQPQDETVVVAQDVDYPGWTVQVDGRPAELVSVGTLLGVVLPPGTTPVLVEFIYTAPTLKIGGVITIITALFCILYLLRAERLLGTLMVLRKRIRADVQGEADKAVTNAVVLPFDNPPREEAASPVPPRPARTINRGLLALIGAAVLFLCLLTTERIFRR